MRTPPAGPSRRPRSLPLPRRLLFSALGAVVMGAVAVFVFLLDSPPVDIYALGGAALFFCVVALIDVVVVVVRMGEGKSTAP